MQNAMRYEYELGGYAMVQSTRPQSLGGMALTDSPVGGLLTWLVERFQDWSAAEKNPEDVFTRDQMLTTVSIYWHFATIWSSMRYYKEMAGVWGGVEPEISAAPLAIAMMPEDLGGPGAAGDPAAQQPGPLGPIGPGGWALRRVGAARLMVADLRAAVPELRAAGG